MKICITSQGGTIESSVDPRFGRCSYYIILDTDTGQHETIENSQIAASGGAGIQAGQMLAEKGVNVVLTGNAGPNAWQTLNAAGIKIITGLAGPVHEAIATFKSGGLEQADGPNVESHSGMKAGS